MFYYAYGWNGKQWILHEDIIAVNKEVSNTVDLKAYDKELDSVVSVPTKSTWINPEDPNSPIDGGRHQAVTPDDLKQEQKGKKPKKSNIEKVSRSEEHTSELQSR